MAVSRCLLLCTESRGCVLYDCLLWLSETTDETFKVTQLVPQVRTQVRTQQCIAEDYVDVPVPRTQEQIDEVVKVMSPERVSERVAEQIVDVPVAKIMEETTEVIQSVLQEQIQEGFVEESIHVPVSLVMEESSEGAKLASQMQSSVDMPAQNTVQIPQVRFIDDTVDVSAHGHTEESGEVTHQQCGLNAATQGLCVSLRPTGTWTVQSRWECVAREMVEGFQHERGASTSASGSERQRHD